MSTSEEQAVFANLQATCDKVQWLLEEIPRARNMSSDSFLALFWSMDGALSPDGRWIDREKITKHETVSRAKRRVVEKNPHLAPTNPKFIERKNLQQAVIEEYMMN